MLKIIVGVIEVIVLLVCIYFGYQWTNNPKGNYEPWLFLSGLIFIALDILRRYEIHLVKREGKVLTPGELIKHSEELRKQFQEEVYKCRAENLRRDIIIRHVNRMDAYPNTDDKEKGISPWFRAGLLDLYHKGIMIGLRFGTLSEGPDGWRFTNYKEGEKGNIEVYMVGKIPYEFIEGVNFDGDEYYYFPHIFCHFAHKGAPYEEIVFCEEVDLGSGHHYYKQIAKYHEVAENSKSWGGEYFA
ncbi:hypothetical protein J6I90_01005 [Pseudidiomarina sp. 1APP75-32.1]|uniref:SMODS-associating 2TM beta-strand rich effector domain-containing protein n=1 Tax=Pseudidiomarina terrestris TaxID=2820060 RepID=A0AAW7QVM0_9GAMM|nr:hypothetical protein [Pseudidiomarina sp. 1APR75-15]MDN7123456.1 hypothetical protein [Pseudidiomarina sp. 1APP75-32.1]